MEKHNIEPYSEPSSHTEGAYKRAEKRLKEIKGFYWHLFWYLAVNIFISTSKILSDIEEGKTFSDIFFDFGTFAVWIFWGIGLGFHWMGVFGKHLVFSKDWEKRKIQKYMDQEKQTWE